MNSVNKNNTFISYKQLFNNASEKVTEPDNRVQGGLHPTSIPPQTQGPDGGGGGGGGYGGTGGGSGVGGGSVGVRAVGAAPSPQQQDKTPPASLTLHHANHMMSTFHSARPPAQPPPSGTSIHPSFLPYANIGPRQQPRHQIATRPAALIPFVPYPDAAMNPLGPQYYSPSPISLPLMFPTNTPGSDTGGRPPPINHFQWSASPQPPITVMTTQPPTAQPNPQQQPQPQPSPYSQNQFTAYVQQPRVHQNYNTGGGPASSAAAAGIQQAPPSVLVDNRQLPLPQAQLQAKTKQIRSSKRIPIIDPSTMKEVNLEDEGSTNFGAGGNVDLHHDHAGGSSHHPTLGHHGSSYQVSSSASGNAFIAADFSNQVLAAMTDDSSNTRPPREEEPQVNGPAGVALVSSSLAVEESSGPTNKRPPGPTPVVSAQAEGTTYDIQTIRSSTSRNIELRSGESSPARSKAPQLNLGQQSSVPTSQHSEQPAASVVIPTEQQVEPPKQQRRPRGPPPTEDKKQPPQPQVISPPQKPPVQMSNPTPRMPIPGPDFTKKVPGLNNDSNTRPQREDEPQISNALSRVPIVGSEFNKKVLGLNNDSNTRSQREEEPQVEEKNEESRSRVSSLSTVKTSPSVKEEEPVVPAVKQAPVVVTTQIVTPQVKQPVTITKPVQQATIPQQIQPTIQPQPTTQSTPTPVVESKIYQPTVEKQPSSMTTPSYIEYNTTPVLPFHLDMSKPPVVEKKPAETRTSVEKTLEKAVPEPVVEKQVVPEPTSEPPRITKVIEKRPISPAVTSVTAPAPKAKTPFANSFSLEALEMNAKAAVSATALAQTASQATASQQQQSEQQSNTTETTHAPTKPVSRAKQKGKQKLREMNQKGAEKEGGTDMDAFVDTRTVSTPLATPVSDNNNRTSSNDTLATKTSDISNRTASTLDNSTKDNRNLDNVIRSRDGTARQESDNKALQDKSPAVTTEDATNNNINNEIAQQYDDSDANDLVAAKNEENMKKSNQVDSNNTESSQVIAPPPLSQPSLKYQYKDDQWSPMNPQGKKVYDRNFLMQLRGDPLSSKKPDITSDLEIFVKDRDNVGGRDSGSLRRGISSHTHYVGSNFGSLGGMRGSSNNPLFPEFSRSLSHRLPAKRNSQGSGSNRGPGGSGGARSLKNIYNSFSMRDEFKLTLNENAWKPSKLAKMKDSESKDEKEVADLYKRVRGILNKLTPQKFETLLTQFQNLPINNLERLQGTIRLVFEKAVDEPAFSISYANLCKMLSRLQVVENSQQQQQQPSSNPDQQSKPPINFRKLLITRCQQEFETNKKLELDFEQKQKDINECPDLEKRKEMQLLFNEEERKIRMRSVGLVTFIGELFKLKMLTVNIMHGCMKQLLEKVDEESLECLCKLLTTIGRDFEEQITSSGGGSNKQNSSSASSIHEFNEYFAQMTRLSKKHEGSKVSSRVRFMLQDVIELRSNRWIPRRDENKPKTMAQIQEDVERESVRKAALLASQPSRSMSQNMSQDRGGQRRSNPRGGNVQSEDGWTSVPTKFSKTTYSSGATIGLRSTAGQELEGRGMKGEMTLAPPNSGQRWSAGAVATSNRMGPGGSAAFTDKNSFSILDEQKQNQGVIGRSGSMKSHADDKSKDNKEVLQSIHAYYQGSSNAGDSNRDSSTEKDSRFHGGPTGGSPSPSLSGPPIKKPIQDPVKKPMEVSRSDRTPTPSSSPAPIDRQSSREAPAPKPIKEIDVEKLPQCVKSIIEEYISNRNVQESVESYKDRFTDHGSIFISNCLNYIVDQTKEEKRTHASQLLGELLRHKLFPASLLVEEIGIFFDYIYDLEVDIPFIWQYIGQIFGLIMCLEVLDFSHVKEASKTIPTVGSFTCKLDLTLKAIFKVLMLEKGPVWIKKCWDSSKVQIKDFANDEKTCSQFLSEFSFLEGKEVPLSDSKIPYEKVQEKLLLFLKGGTDNFDQIYGWLSTNVGQRTNEPTFIRHLTEAVIKASLVSDDRKMQKLDKELFHKNMILIKRYVDNKEELELLCLYSVQHLVVATLESPSGMLVDIFQGLYENMVISPDGFNKWRQEDAMSQSWQKEGRGVAVAVLNNFFTQVNQALSNDEHDEDDDLPS